MIGTIQKITELQWKFKTSDSKWNILSFKIVSFGSYTFVPDHIFGDSPQN